MSPEQIKAFLETYSSKRQRTIVIIDFANVEKWNNSLHWDVSVPKLAGFIKNLSQGDKELRRFYYGSDFGQSERSTTLTPWSAQMLQHAQYNNMELKTKRVKYIHDQATGQFRKKCDFDVEMALDLIRLQEKYDQVILFSGDGDLVCALEYLKDEFGKEEFYVFGARGHVGAEVMDAEKTGLISKVFYADDFEYRLSRTYGGQGGRHRGSRKRKRNR